MTYQGCFIVLARSAIKPDSALGQVRVVRRTTLLVVPTY